MHSRQLWDVPSPLASPGYNACAMSPRPQYVNIQMDRSAVSLSLELTSTFYFLKGDFHVTLEVGSVTFFDDPLQRIRTGQIARVPILLGSLEGDGTVFSLPIFGASQNLSIFLIQTLGPLQGLPLPMVVQSFYPSLDNTQLLAAVARDIIFSWCVLAQSQKRKRTFYY
jgi:hypothetical protein